MKTIYDAKLIDIMPDSISHDKNVRPASDAIDTQLHALASNIDIASIYMNIDRLPSVAMDHLAKQYDISVWRDSWPDNLKRSVLKSAISEKRKKGTVGAVKKALESLGSAASIVEWWQQTPKGAPHTFTIYATQSKIDGVIDSEMQQDIIAMIDDAKPLRSHYNFVVQEHTTGTIGIYGCMRVLTRSVVRTTESAVVDIEGAVGVVAVARPIIKRHLIATA